jgi:hypothetical protein
MVNTRTSFTIDVELLKSFKIACVRENTSMGDKINRMIITYLDELGWPSELYQKSEDGEQDILKKTK